MKHVVELCLVQQAPVFFNLPETQALACRLIEAYGREGVDLLVFPETWLCGYPVWLDLAPEAGLWHHPGARMLFRLLFESAVCLEGETLAALSAAAQAGGVTVVIGANERCGKTLYNTLFYLSPDGRVLPHRKLVPTYTERLVWGRGDGSTLAALDTPFGTVGGLICWEHWMPLARAAMQARQEVIHVAQWPEVNDLHRMAARHYAFEGGCFVAASGCYFTKGDMLAGLAGIGGDTGAAAAMLASMPGSDDTPLRRGLSAVYGPDASVVVEAPPGPDAVRVTLDTRTLIETRLTLDTAGHYARPDVFRLHVDTRAHSGVCFAPGDGEGRSDS